VCDRTSSRIFADLPRQAAWLFAAVETIGAKRRNNPVAFSLQAKPLSMFHCYDLS
jgi:hypothetical protein